MYFRINIILVIILVSKISTTLSHSTMDQTGETNFGATCGLGAIMPEQSFTTYPLFDQVEENDVAWYSALYGSVRKIVVNSSPHVPYLKGSFCPTTQFYKLMSTERTKLFPRDMMQRIIHRNITFECEDGSFYTYYLQVPLWNKLQPQYISDTRHAFNIPLDFNRTHPVSDWYCCLFAANVSATEVKNHRLALKECSSNKTTSHNLTYNFVKLWPNTLPDPQSYNIVFKLGDDVQLRSGMIISKCYLIVDGNGLQSAEALHIDVHVE